MFIAIFILGVLQIISTIVVFFLLLPVNIIAALIALLLGAIQACLPFAVLKAMSDAESAKIDTQLLREAIRKLENSTSGSTSEQQTAQSHTPVANSFQMTARHTWECVKCQTVNKTGTTKCSNCGAAYSFANSRV